MGPLPPLTMVGQEPMNEMILYLFFKVLKKWYILDLRISCVFFFLGGCFLKITSLERCSGKSEQIP